MHGGTSTAHQRRCSREGHHQAGQEDGGGHAAHGDPFWALEGTPDVWPRFVWGYRISAERRFPPWGSRPSPAGHPPALGTVPKMLFMPTDADRQQGAYGTAGAVGATCWCAGLREGLEGPGGGFRRFSDGFRPAQPHPRAARPRRRSQRAWPPSPCRCPRPATRGCAARRLHPLQADRWDCRSSCP